MVHNGPYLGFENNIFNEILENHNITKAKIYAFVNISAYQQGKSPEKRICAVTAGNNINILSIPPNYRGGQMPLSIAGVKT